MELGPTNELTTEQTSSDEKKDTKKSKKKDAEKLGALVVDSKADDQSKKTGGLWEKILADEQSAKKLEKQKPESNAERSPNDKNPELDSEAPLEHLSEVERQATVAELAAARRQELKAELAAEGDETVLQQTEAADAFLAKAEVSGDLEAAYAETVQEFDDQEEQTHAAEPFALEGVIDTTREDEGEVRLQAVADPEDEPYDAMAAGGASGSSVQQPTSASTGSSTGGGASGPPRQPGGVGGGVLPPGGASGGRAPGFGGGYTSGAGPGYNTAPTGQAYNPNTLSAQDAAYYEARALGRGVAAGGIVGYLIGRRRGRIKTEKRLMPVQRKLEREVKDLQFSLVEKEIAVRKAAVEKYQAILSPASERLILTAAKQKRELRAENDVARLSKLPSERIGHVIVTAESTRNVPENRLPKSTGAEARAIEKEVATMSRTELLSLSEKIAVDGSTLRQIYETHLVGERGLRRLVTEYLRGGDVQRVLRRELVEREIDFERDPILRDRARASLAGGGKSALNSLVQQAGAVAVLADKSKAAASTKPTADVKTTHHPSSNRMADAALITTITLLLLVILMLLMRG